ncbi:MAG: shikimate dehydrogenase [Parachlamydiaceae bacterium]
MICVVITGPSFEEAHRQISQALEDADLVELRLDCFTSLDIRALEKLRSQFTLPMLFTLRSQSQGGNYTQTEENRLEDIRLLASLKPEYLDLEFHVPSSFVQEISSQYPEIKIILSYHNFTETPLDLEGLYQEMQKTPAFYYKIAVTPQHCLDTMRLLCWTKSCNTGNLNVVGMGDHGQISRILGPVVGCPITYATIDENSSYSTALGQLSAKTLVERYHHRSLGPQTALYGLIGNPVDKSISDVTHNHLMSLFNLDAVYVKIEVKPSEVGDFLQFARQLSFCGLSVTMPLKECVLPYLDAIDPEALAIGAVNTLVFSEKGIAGFNTDGIGALSAIEEQCSVKNKRIVILGAGGAAKAIAYEALRRGALVTIVNRTVEKAHLLAQRLHCTGMGLEQMSDCVAAGYDILINCTSVSMPISPDDILPQTLVMDVVTSPKETVFVRHALEKRCRIVYGHQMFAEQALGQFQRWCLPIGREALYSLKNL